jgi:MtN3 and saliva related transmembrane protein
MEFFLGFFAAFCTTVAFVPQAIKVYKTKSTLDISLGMFLLMTVGVGAWLIYGIIINSLPIIMANGVTLLLSIYILIMKIKLDYMPKKFLQSAKIEK